MAMEHRRLREHAQGKMARALGHALPGETREALERIAAEDRRLAQNGMVQLKGGERIYHKHVDELTREDRTDRIAAERATVDWLKQRVESRKLGTEAPPTPAHLRRASGNAVSSK